MTSFSYRSTWQVLLTICYRSAVSDRRTSKIILDGGLRNLILPSWRALDSFLKVSSRDS